MARSAWGDRVGGVVGKPALTPFALLGAPAAFADTTNCATKIRAIETQIEMAKQYGNTFRIAGLQDALASTKANCTNAGQADHAERKVREAERDVQKAQLEVTEAEDKLKESRSKGEVKRIAKAQIRCLDSRIDYERGWRWRSRRRHN